MGGCPPESGKMGSRASVVRFPGQLSVCNVKSLLYRGIKTSWGFVCLLLFFACMSCFEIILLLDDSKFTVLSRVISR